MQSKTNRRGLAWSAVIALFASIFAITPASSAATDGANIAIRPMSNAETTNFAGLLDEDFALYSVLLPGAGNANNNFATGTLIYEIERVSGAMDIVAMTTTISSTVGGANYGLTDDTLGRDSSSADVTVDSGGHFGATYSEVVSVWATSTSATLSARVGSSVAPLYIRAVSGSSTVGVTSVSPNVTVKVTAFIDELAGANGQLDEGEWYTTQTITLYASSRLAPSLTLAALDKGDTVVTASATLNTLNWTNLDGKMFLAVSTSDTTAVFTKTGAGVGTSVTSSAITGAQASARAGVVSESFATNALTESTVIGMQLRYDQAGTATNIASGIQLGAQGWTQQTVAAPAASNISISAVAGDNILGSGGSYTVRPNQTYTVTVFASTNSVSVSTDVTVTLTGTGLVTSSKLLSINGGAYLTAYPADGFTVATGANGYGSFTFATSGFVDGDHVSVSAAVGNTVQADHANGIRFETDVPAYTVEVDSDLFAVTPGGTLNIVASVKDQFDVASAMTNQYIKLTRATVTGFNWASTISYHAVSGGTTTVPFVGQPAAATGSVGLTFDLVKLENGAYISDGTADTATVTVTGNANDFGSGLAASYAASVSYFPSTVSWVTVTGTVDVTGSSVVVTGDSSLVFRKSAALPATSSGTLTINSNASAEYSFQVASLHSGDETITLTNGSATTTSLLVVADAASDYGSAITWDTTEIVAGRTKVVVGTLVDANGNAVNTTGVGSTAGDSGTASIVVTYGGTAGIVVGSMPTETDADGKFRISVLTSAADQGTLNLTAVYMPQGAATITAKKMTSLQAITVGSTTGAASSDQKGNAGSFKGYVAVYAKGYEGQRLSAKIGNDWVVVDSLASNFERVVDFTGAGYTIAVRIYIDRVLVDTITVTTK